MSRGGLLLSYAGNMVVVRSWGPPSSIMGPGIVLAAVVVVQYYSEYSTVWAAGLVGRTDATSGRGDVDGSGG